MKTLLLLIITLSICLFEVPDLHGQEKGFEVPSRYVKVLLVSDPKSPLKLSGPSRVIGYSNGGFYFGYTETNVSNENIDEYVVEQLSWFGHRGYNVPVIVNKNDRFFSGRSVFTSTDLQTGNLVPFDEGVAREAGITLYSNRIWIIFVTKVKLSDGSTYDATSKFNLLEKFCQELGLDSKMSEADLKVKEQRLNKFIADLLSN